MPADEADDDTLSNTIGSSSVNPVAAAEALLLQCVNPALLFPTLFAATSTTFEPPTVGDCPPQDGYDSDDELDRTGDSHKPANELYNSLNPTEVSYTSFFNFNIFIERVVCIDT